MVYIPHYIDVTELCGLITLTTYTALNAMKSFYFGTIIDKDSCPMEVPSLILNNVRYLKVLVL